jgi:hypothetical protein
MAWRCSELCVGRQILCAIKTGLFWCLQLGHSSPDQATGGGCSGEGAWFSRSGSRRALRTEQHVQGKLLACDANTDLLPAGTQISIRKLLGSAELSAYRYQETAPKALEPIFGTDGSTNALYWNGMMFHPVFAAPPGTNGLTATFEAYSSMWRQAPVPLWRKGQRSLPLAAGLQMAAKGCMITLVVTVGPGAIHFRDKRYREDLGAGVVLQ